MSQQVIPDALGLPSEFYVGNNSVQTMNTEAIILVVEKCEKKEL